MEKSAFNYQLTDEALCKQVARGDRIAEETLVMRYNRFVRMCARPYFLAGGDSEDLIQEGMLGLLSAIREFTSDRGTAFQTYAATCIRNRILSAVKAASRNKHSPLNNAVSLEALLFDGKPDGDQPDPEELFLWREEQAERMAWLKDGLSKLEKSILRLYLSGLSYSEIADTVNKSPKSVDNAVQRIRRKIAQRSGSGVISES